MLEIPNEAFEVIGDNWNELGYNPIFIFRLCERGYLHCEIDFAMRRIIGDDWVSLKASEWIDRLADAGLPSMLYSLEHDTPPVIDILDEEIALLLSNTYPEELCDECKKIRLKERHLNEISQ